MSSPESAGSVSKCNAEICCEFIGDLGWLVKRRSFADLVPILQKVNRPLKELSEALPVFYKIYDETVFGKWTAIDLCSGKHALLGSLIALNTRNVNVIAVDIEEPDPHIGLINRLHYLQANIHSPRALRRLKDLVQGKVIVAGIHCCKTLAFRTIEIARELGAVKGYLVPCCTDFPAARRLGLWDGGSKTYETWVEILVKYAERLGFNTSVTRAPMLSEKNALITFFKPRKPAAPAGKPGQNREEVR